MKNKNLGELKKRQRREQVIRITDSTKNISIENMDDKNIPNKKIGIKESSLKKDKNKFRIKLSFWDKFKIKRYPEHTFLIRMFFSNGTSKMFVIKTNEMTFKMKDKLYYLFYEEASFDLSTNQFILFYHEKYSAPINREVSLDGDEVFFSVTPENLRPLIEMKYVDAIVRGDTKMRWGIIIGAIVVVVIIFVFMNGGGG